MNLGFSNIKILDKPESIIGISLLIIFTYS